MWSHRPDTGDFWADTHKSSCHTACCPAVLVTLMAPRILGNQSKSPTNLHKAAETGFCLPIVDARCICRLFQPDFLGCYLYGVAERDGLLLGLLLELLEEDGEVVGAEELRPLRLGVLVLLGSLVLSARGPRG
jgi:hypothetical protein